MVTASNKYTEEQLIGIFGKYNLEYVRSKDKLAWKNKYMNFVCDKCREEYSHIYGFENIGVGDNCLYLYVNNVQQFDKIKDFMGIEVKVHLLDLGDVKVT